MKVILGNNENNSKRWDNVVIKTNCQRCCTVENEAVFIFLQRKVEVKGVLITLIERLKVTNNNNDEWKKGRGKMLNRF